MKNDIKMMHEQISDIQNLFWKAYKTFLDSGSIRQYEKDVWQIQDKYEHDRALYPFTQNLAVTWVPVINAIKQKMIGKE